MLWDEFPPESQRKVLSHFGVTLGGIGFNFVEEAISAPTDRCFREDHHVGVVYRNGRLRSMNSEFEDGPSGQILPKVGDIWVIPAEQRYAALAQGDTVGFCEMKVPTALLRGEAVMPCIGYSDPFLHRTLDKLAGLGTRDDDLAHLLRDALGETIRLHLLDHYAPPAQTPTVGGQDKLTPAQERLLVAHIDEQLDRRHRLADMAALVQLPVPELLVAFAGSFGATPYQFVIGRRIRRGKELLAHSRAPITEIGLAVGFSTPSHFATSFRQAVGLSPSAYRNAVGVLDR
jgi:AraC family transcriptional regulator